jgi:hypothetical protein
MVLTLDTPTQRRLENKARQENRTTEEVAATLLASVLLTDNAPSRETELWRLLGEGLPETFWSRREELETKVSARTLTPTEHEERLSLITQMEQWQVRRLQMVVELAKLRGEKPSDLLQRIGENDCTCCT